MSHQSASDGRVAVGFAPVCPSCNSLALQLNGSCPSCGGYALSAVPLAHHIPCAGIFEAPQGLELVEYCPKCHRNDVGDSDHLETVGEIYYCDDCGDHFPEPSMHLHCQSCQRHHRFGDAQFEIIYSDVAIEHTG